MNQTFTKRKWPARLLLFGLVAFSGWINPAKGQLAMTRSGFTGTYTPIATGTGATLSTASGDDGTQTNVPIGFTFNYLGTNYTNVAISTNGWISFNATTTSGSFSNGDMYSTSGPNNALFPWFDDLNAGLSSVAGAPSILFQTQGTAGSQTFTVQWTNFCAFRTAGGSAINFQVVLYEGTNVIEFRYGPRTVGTLLTGQSASIGIENSTGGPGNYLDALTGSSRCGHFYMSEHQWPQYFFRFTPGAPTPLAAGTYNVGVGQTYMNLTEAFADLNQRGVAGAVTFNLTDATYDSSAANGMNLFPLLLGPITGTSASNTVTFTKSGAAPSINWGGNISGSTNGEMVNGTTTTFNTSNVEPIIGLVGADYITLDNLRINGNVGFKNADYALGVFNNTATNGSTNNIFSNLTINMRRANTGSRAIFQNVPVTPSSAAGANSNNIYRNLSISNVYTGIYLLGNSTFPDLACEIGTSACGTFNTIGDGATANDIGNGGSQTYGIRVNNQSGFKVYNNRVRNVTGNAVQTDGILIESFQGVSQVYNNQVQTIKNSGTSSTSATSGLRMSHATTGTHSIRVYNNAISEIISSYTGSATATRTLRGIFINGTGGTTSQVYEIHNNSVSIDGGGSLNLSSACFEISTASGPVYQLSNNIFANFTAAQTGVARHYSLVSTSATNLGATGTTSNKNDLFVANDLGTTGFPVLGNTTTYSTVAAWTTASTFDAASFAVNPLYVNNLSDLHSNAGSLNNQGLAPQAYITNDLDCAARTDNDLGAYNNTVPVCTGTPAAGSITGTSALCSGNGTTLSFTPGSTDAGISYQWASGPAAGGPFTNLGTATTQATGTLTATTYYVVTTTCSFSGLTSTTTPFALTINPLPTITASPASPAKCDTDPAVAITASGAATYTWSPATGLSATTGTTVNANPSGTTTYTITGTDANSCVNTGTVTLTVNATPLAPVVTPASPAICSGGSIVLSATAGFPSTTGILGTGTSTTTQNATSSTDYPNPLHHYYGGNKHQMLIRASELSALGLGAGYNITSIAFPIASVNTTEALQSYIVRVGHTALTTMTAFQTGLTTVRAAAPYTPATTGFNTITFDTPFTWNGTDNIIIETSYSNNDAPSSGNNTMTYGTTAYQSTIVYRVDNTSAATVNAYTGTQSYSYNSRPNIRFTWTNPATVPGSNISWSPGTGLSATTGSSVTANPATTTTYSVTAVNAGCTSAAASVTLNVGAPLVCTGISGPSGLICEGTSISLTSTLTGGGAPYSYAWTDGIGTVYPDAATISPVLPAGTYTFDVTVTDACGSSCTSSLTITINAAGGSITGPAAGVTYQNLTYVAAGYPAGSTFQWQSATVSGGPYTNITGATNDTLTISRNALGTYHYVCIITAPAGCVVTTNQVSTTITLAGDNVCSAVPLNPGLNGPFTNVGATTQSGEAVPTLGSCTGQSSWCSASGGISNTVWFSFVAPASGKASIHFVPGSWDSEIALWSAPNCGALLSGGGTLIAANDDSTGSSPYNAFIDVTCLVPGQTYYVQVDGYGSTTNNNFSLFLKTSYTNAAPVIAGMPSNITVSNDAGACGAAVTWTAPTMSDSDNCIASLSSLTGTHSSGDVFPLGTTTVTYTATDGVNTVTASFDVTVNDTELPAITGTPSDISIVNNNTGCTAIVTWTAPAASDNCGTPTLTATHNSGDVFPLGTTVVTYTATDANGNNSTSSFNVTVTSDLSASLTSSTDVFCNGGNDGSADITVTGTGTPYTYDWSNSETTEDVTGLNAGSYTVIVTDANSCTDTVTVSISEPAAITGSQTLNLCDGQSVTVGSSTYNTTGVYTDVLTAANGCDSTVTTNLTVNAPVNTGTSVAAATITASSATGTFQWINCATNTPIAGETGASFTASANGDYAVIVTEGGCTDTSACVNINSVGLGNGINSQAFGLYPNPTQGDFTIVSTTAARMNIVNTVGEVIMSGNLNKGENKFNAANLTRGMYMVNITDANGQLLHTQRLVVTR